MLDASNLHLLSTCALIGLVWTVQVAVYPLFDRTGQEGFPAWHAAYTARIGRVAGPLMLAELGSGLWLLESGRREPLFMLSLALLGGIWLSTALVQVPLHHRLAQGFEAGTHRRLVRTNWLRTCAWTLRGLCLLF